MPAELTNKDYISILKLYDIKIPRSRRLLKKQAEHIMAKKLCKCIKKLDNIHESKSIGICTKTIFNNKGYSRGKFSCRKKQQVKIKKKNKTRKNK